MRRTMPVLALVVSLISVTLSIIACSRAETRALAAVSDREARLVEWLTPKMKKVLQEFDVPAYPESPRTLEEALTPLFSLIGPSAGS